MWPGPGDPAALLATVLATGRGYVAAGADHAGNRPFAVSSADGVTWAQEPMPGDDRTPYALVPWGDRVLAVGAGGAQCAHPFGVDTWVRSADATWSEAPFKDLLCDGSDVHLAVFDDLAILVGSGPGDNAVVWSSKNGLGWVDHSGPFSGLLPRAVVTDGQSAVLVAEASTGTWSASTSDGSTWTAPALIPGFPTGLHVDGAFWIGGAPTIVATDGGVLGSIRPDGSGGWTTTASVGLSADLLGTITAFDGGLLAVGGPVNGPGARAWVSADGASWRPFALPEALSSEGASVGGVAVRDGRAILIGSVANGADNAVSTVWTGSADLVRP